MLSRESNSLDPTPNKLVQRLTFYLPFLFAVIFYSIHVTDNLFGDEFATYRWSVLGEPISTTTGKPASPFNIDILLAKFGYVLIGQDWGIRLASVLFALGTIFLTGKVAKSLLGEKYVRPSLWIAALSPMLIVFGAEARPYAVVAFSGTLLLYSTILFSERETWWRAIGLGLAGAFATLAHQVMISYLVFIAGYYGVRNKNISKYFMLASLITIPFIIRLIYLAMIYQSKAPHISVGHDPVSILNFIGRAVVAMNFGYSTFSLPELGLARNVPFMEVLYDNALLIALTTVSLCSLLFGLYRALKIYPDRSLFLILFIFVPSVIIVIVGQLGYSIVREKYLIGAIGAWFLLLSVIYKEFSAHPKLRFLIIPYLLVLVISLINYFIWPEVYSRRSYPAQLNQKIIEMAAPGDCIIAYHIAIATPNYYVFAQKSSHPFIDIYDEIRNNPQKTNVEIFDHYLRNLDQNCKENLFFIYNVAMKNMVDPDGYLLSKIDQRMTTKKFDYGRNLKLYMFQKEKNRDSDSGQR